jgi:hypothetical protein
MLFPPFASHHTLPKIKKRAENANAGHIWLQADTCLQNSSDSAITTTGFFLRRRKLLI